MSESDQSGWTGTGSVANVFARQWSTDSFTIECKTHVCGVRRTEFSFVPVYDEIR